MEADWAEKFYDTLRLGEDIYTYLQLRKPSDGEIFISPFGIGDVVWVCTYARQYKRKLGYDNILLVAREYACAAAKLFPDIDDVMALDERQNDALKKYIATKGLYYENGIRYAHFHAVMHPESLDLDFHERNFLEAYDHSIGIRRDDILSQMEIPNPIDDERAKVIKDSILLVPKAFSTGMLQADFWRAMAERMQSLGYKVFTNDDGHTEAIPKTELFRASIEEIASYAKYFKAILAVRTGLCDLLAMTEANLHVIYLNQGGMDFFSLQMLVNNPKVREYVYAPAIQEQILHDMNL